LDETGVGAELAERENEDGVMILWEALIKRNAYNGEEDYAP